MADDSRTRFEAAAMVVDPTGAAYFRFAAGTGSSSGFLTTDMRAFDRKRAFQWWRARYRTTVHGHPLRPTTSRVLRIVVPEKYERLTWFAGFILEQLGQFGDALLWVEETE